MGEEGELKNKAENKHKRDNVVVHKLSRILNTFFLGGVWRLKNKKKNKEEKLTCMSDVDYLVYIKINICTII